MGNNLQIMRKINYDSMQTRPDARNLITKYLNNERITDKDLRSISHFSCMFPKDGGDGGQSITCTGDHVEEVGDDIAVNITVGLPQLVQFATLYGVLYLNKPYLLSLIDMFAQSNNTNPPNRHRRIALKTSGNFFNEVVITFMYTHLTYANGMNVEEITNFTPTTGDELISSIRELTEKFRQVFGKPVDFTEFINYMESMAEKMNVELELREKIARRGITDEFDKDYIEMVKRILNEDLTPNNIANMRATFESNQSSFSDHNEKLRQFANAYTEFANIARKVAE